MRLAYSILFILIFPLSHSQLPFSTTGPIAYFSGACPEGWQVYVNAAGHFILSSGNYQGLYDSAPVTYSSGSTGGEAKTTLDVQHLPPHDHSNGAYNQMLWLGPGRCAPSFADKPGWPDITSTPSQILPAGGDQPHNNLPQYLALVACQKQSTSFAMTAVQASTNAAISAQFQLLQNAINMQFGVLQANLSAYENTQSLLVQSIKDIIQNNNLTTLQKYDETVVKINAFKDSIISGFDLVYNQTKDVATAHRLLNDTLTNLNIVLDQLNQEVDVFLNTFVQAEVKFNVTRSQEEEDMRVYYTRELADLDAQMPDLEDLILVGYIMNGIALIGAWVMITRCWLWWRKGGKGKGVGSGDFSPDRSPEGKGKSHVAWKEVGSGKI